MHVSPSARKSQPIQELRATRCDAPLLLEGLAGLRVLEAKLAPRSHRALEAHLLHLSLDEVEVPGLAAVRPLPVHLAPEAELHLARTQRAP
eukprot:8250730-Alexandrium_andersonii.AAC.1